ncbi:MAG: hypothetical protein NUW21_12210 [Elusimicrobia bacterium]|nr:hypothetical protein [Elusimicrobiota bacterium]
MKTPSSLALILFLAALPASAEPKPGERCDVKWLEETQAIMSQSGRSVTDERVEVVGNLVKLKFGSPKTCDAATWRQLATVEPVGEPVLDPQTRQPVGGTALRWRNRAAGDFWKDATVARHIGLVLVVDDFFRVVDAKAAAIVAAGDEVIDAAKALGLADFTVSEKTLGELSRGTSGGSIAAVKPRLVTVFEKDKRVPATLAPNQLGPTLRKLVNDGPVRGDAVVRFRVAVLDLEAELGRLGNSDAFLKKRVTGGTEGLKDFTSGLPAGFVPVEAVPANAQAQEKYASALSALVGPGEAPALESQGLRSPALLDPIDLALRNLIAVRSAQVDRIHAAAVDRLEGKKIAQIEVSARASAEAAKLPENSLAASVVKRLSESPDYQQLDIMYAGNIERHGADWAKTPDGLAMSRAREEMLKAARSATVETAADGSKVVVFTQGGRKVALTSVIPDEVEKDASARNDVAGIISRYIVEGAKEDAQNRALWAAIGGTGQPGQPLDTGLTGGESALARTLPPESKKIKDGAAGCESPKDLVRNDYETYAARRREAAAEMAGDNVRSRNDVEKLRLEQLEAADIACARKKAEAAAIKQDYFDDPAIAAAARKKAAAEAEAECVKARQDIEAAAKAKIEELAAAEKGDRDPAKLRTKADEELAVAFGASILGSVDVLRKEYTTVGSPRLKKLHALTGGSSKLTAHTAMWFDKEWPVDAARKPELQAAVSACAKALGLGDASDSPSYRNPEKPDTVDEHCKINEKLTAYIKDSAARIRPVP